MYSIDKLPQDITDHVGFKYMMDVLEGRTIACKYVKWACLRQYNDLHHAHERGFYFSSDMADIMLDSVREYKHYKGSLFAGLNFEPTPPQVFLNWCLFGWYDIENNVRRFQEVYYEVARKNGKTFQGATTGMYMFEADGEPAAECYTVATKLKQAKIAHEDAKAVVNKAPFLKEKVKILRDNMSISATYSKFEPLGRESDTEDGLNPHYALIDEFHAHKDNEMYNVIDSALGAREQALVYIITTAGTNPQGPCYKHREYMVKILDPENEIQNDSVLPMIYTLDKDDDPFDEAVWEKANPNMPYIKTLLPRLRKKALAAKDSPTTLVNFKTKHLNIWCSADHPWIDMAKWASNDGEFDPRDLIGKTCYGGLDLASVNDLTSLTLTFPPEQQSIASQRAEFREIIIKEIRKAQSDMSDYAFSFLLDEKEDDIEAELSRKDYIIPDPYRIIPYFFVPEDNIKERSKDHGVNYDLWVKDKACNFFATPGAVTDYSFIDYEIGKAKARYDIRELAYDPYNAAMLIQSQQDKDIECVEIVQNWSNMSWASKEFEMLYKMGLLAFNNNEVLSWNASNVVIHMGPSGNYKPTKAQSKEKIDGIISLIMGLNRAILNENIKPKKSRYDDDNAEVLAF